jgi:hypothetical protein
LRRIVLIAAALGCLVAAGAAFAAINTYSAGLQFKSKKGGTAAKPVPANFTQTIKASGVKPNRTAVLTDIKTTIYGLKANGAKPFASCSFKSIQNSHTDAGCPKAAMVASGAITAAIGSASDFTAARAPCAPLLHVWNSGQGKLTFFFVDQAPSHLCVGTTIKTGDVGPYPARYKNVGKNFVLDVPVPSYVSFPLGAGKVAGSLETEHLVFTSQKKGGKLSLESVGCKGNKRPWSMTFKAVLPTTNQTQTKTVSGSSPCSK